MHDGFHWTRVTSKQLRFLFEEITWLPPPPKMKELAEVIDRTLVSLSQSGAKASPEVRDEAAKAKAGPAQNNGFESVLLRRTENPPCCACTGNVAVREPTPVPSRLLHEREGVPRDEQCADL
jgi:hypothetical protein